MFSKFFYLSLICKIKTLYYYFFLYYNLKLFFASSFCVQSNFVAEGQYNIVCCHTKWALLKIPHACVMYFIWYLARVIVIKTRCYSYNFKNIYFSNLWKSIKFSCKILHIGFQNSFQPLISQNFSVATH